MSALTASIASIWSAVSRYGNDRSSAQLPLAVGRERVPAPRLALGVEVEQLAGELARRAAGACLDASQRFEPSAESCGALAAGADVAGDLRELVGGREDLVVAAVLELEVVAGDAGDGLGLEAGEAGDAVVGVDDVVADPQVGEARQPAAGRRRGRRRRRWTRRRNGITASVSSGATNPSLSGASANSDAPAPPPGRSVVEEAGVDAVEVVARALGLAAVLEGRRPRGSRSAARARADPPASRDRCAPPRSGAWARTRLPRSSVAPPTPRR